MFDNIGGKIKKLAKVLCWFGIVASVIWALVTWILAIFDPYMESVGKGFLVLILGCLSSWIGSFFIYGYGQLIEDTSINCQQNADILEYFKNVKEKQDVERRN